MASASTGTQCVVNYANELCVSFSFDELCVPSYKHTLCCVSTSNKERPISPPCPSVPPTKHLTGGQLVARHLTSWSPDQLVTWPAGHLTSWSPDQLTLLCVCSEGRDVAPTKCTVYGAGRLMTSPSECFMDTNISWRRFTWTRFSRSKYRTALQISSVDDKKTSSVLVWKVLHFSALLLFLPEDCF